MFFSRSIRVFLTSIALLHLVCRAASAQLADTPWPMFHHDLRHTGQASVSGPASAHLKWVYDNPSRWTCMWNCPTFSSSPTVGAVGHVLTIIAIAIIILWTPTHAR